MLNIKIEFYKPKDAKSAAETYIQAMYSKTPEEFVHDLMKQREQSEGAVSDWQS